MALPTYGVTADVALFTGVDRQLHLLLVKRGVDPFAGLWALPGGFVEPDEDLVEAACRELAEETGIAIDPQDLKQTGVYGEPGRDPRMRVITIVFSAYVAELADPIGGDDAAEARLWPVSDLLVDSSLLAFDHHRVISETVNAMRLRPR